MNYFYDVKVRYNTPVEGSDEVKTVNESYYIVADHVSESIERATEEIGSGKDDFDILSTKRSNVTDYIEVDDAEKIYMVKVGMLVENEQTGKMKTVPEFYLVDGDSTKDIISTIEMNFQNRLVNKDEYKILATSLLKNVVEVFN